MNRITLALCLMLFLATQVNAQQDEELETKPIRPTSFGFGITFNDFLTARNIRNSSLTSALINDQFSKLGDMASGISVMYAKGLLPHLDFAASLSFTSGSVVLLNKPDQIKNRGFFAADASVQAKMVPENFRLIPYLSAGVGATTTQGYYGAILPLGVGLRFRISDEFSLGLQSQYRIAVTETSGYHLMHGLSIMGRL